MTAQTEEGGTLAIASHFSAQLNQLIRSIDGFETASQEDKVEYLLGTFGELARITGEAVMQLEVAFHLLAQLTVKE